MANFAGIEIHPASQATMDKAQMLGMRIVAQAEGCRIVAYQYNGDVYIESIQPAPLSAEIPAPRNVMLGDRQLHRAGQTTSIAALKATRHSRQTMIERVYRELAKYRDGAIPEEIAGDRYNVPPFELIDVRRAFHSLKKNNLIEETGEERKNPKGHYCKVYRVKSTAAK